MTCIANRVDASLKYTRITGYTCREILKISCMTNRTDADSLTHIMYSYLTESPEIFQSLHNKPYRRKICIVLSQDTRDLPGNKRMEVPIPLHMGAVYAEEKMREEKLCEVWLDLAQARTREPHFRWLCIDMAQPMR